MKKYKRNILARVAVTGILACASLPANATLIKYNFFSYMANSTGIAAGTLSYDTHRGFTEASIFTTPDPDCCRGQGHPGGLYNQVDLLGQADRPFEFWVWEQSATGVIGDAAMFINFIPWESGSLLRLEVGHGVEGYCAQTANTNGCLITQTRTMSIGSGRAIAQEVLPLGEPATTRSLLLIGMLATALLAANRRKQKFLIGRP